MARLDVFAENPCIHLARRPDRVHRLGFSEAPLFEILQPWAADDGWDVRALASGRSVDSPLSSSDIADSFTDWRRGSRTSSGSAILEHLPVASYLLIRTALAPSQSDWIDIGNDCVKATPSMRNLMHGGLVDAVLVGAPLHQPPRLDVPLIGMPILNDTGLSFAPGSAEPHQHAVVFLPFALGDGLERTDTGDLILVVPADGELIIDNLGSFDADDERESRHRWKEEFLPAFADACSEAR